LAQVWVTRENGDDGTCEKFFLHKQADAFIGGEKPLLDLLPRGSILVVDRFGRSGASKYPIAGHYMPRIKAAFHRRGIGYMCLPPHGALQNPIEILWNILKSIIADMRPDGEPEDAWEQIIRGPRFLSEALPMIRLAVLQMNENPGVFRHAFHRRAEGNDLTTFLKGNKRAEAVLAARAVRPQRRPMDLAAVAHRMRLVNIHASENEKLTTDAQRATYARYVVAHLHEGTAEGLSFPLAAGAPGKNGREPLCRVCQRKAPKTPKGTSQAPPDKLLSCQAAGCSASYHWWCLGLRGVPTGHWTCLECHNGAAIAGPSATLPGLQAGTRFKLDTDSDDSEWDSDLCDD